MVMVLFIRDWGIVKESFPFLNIMVNLCFGENNDEMYGQSSHFHLMGFIMGFCVENGYGGHSVI